MPHVYIACLSICDFHVGLYFSHRSEYFENIFKADRSKLKVFALIDHPDKGDLVQREHPQNWGGIWMGL